MAARTWSNRLDFEASQFVGYIETLRHGKIIGWCASRYHSDPIQCELVFGDTSAAQTTANIHRADLEDLGFNQGYHGFEFDLRALDLDKLMSAKWWPVIVRIIETNIVLPLTCFSPFLSEDKFKYHHPYLANFFTPEQRLYIYDKSIGFVFRAIIDDQFYGPGLIWQRHEAEYNAVIDLKYADYAPQEGEFQLTFSVNKTTLYSLTFSIIPGSEVGHKAAYVIFIGGFQGRPKCRDQFKIALQITKDMHPNIMLMLSLQALGQSWGLETIAAVCAKQQLSARSPELLTRLEHVYDQFWLNFGGTQLTADGNVFFMSTTPRAKPKDSNSHRQRAVKRLAARNAVYSQILDNLGQHSGNRTRMAG